MRSIRPTFTESDFRKATVSQPNQSCVEIARRSGWAEVRDSKTAFGAANDHRIALADPEPFLTAVRADRFGRRGSSS
ncbi:hypothetical protein BLA60_28495 [Actinophytocola xinjiangensis]|uniref:DUF397 domain-containing protein n=1 Tax=Actinophytocola xinjiangensis TaxID=485602 RepID=A0A7Z0WIT9_9PSEU|nr:DUF397 domain-containing protein [Actinophytocola xinjiangensis]OLF07153.1 hypothetical protein BLA60_28495 [Actinophytocola xinjiangensis]